MIAAIYARKSTSQDDVVDESKSTGRQIAAARTFIDAKGWTLSEDDIFVDEKISGAMFTTRPDFQRMMAQATARAFDALVLYDLDRLGRDGHKTMVALHTLADLDIAIWDSSTGQPIALDTFEHRLPTILKAEFAQQFREDIRKKTREAMHFKAQQGFVTGSKVYGYTNERIGKGHVERKISEAEAAVVRDIYARFADGAGARAIAEALNRAGTPSPRAQQGRPSGWSASTIRAVLERPLYRGQLVYGRTEKAYGRELKKAYPKTKREKGLVARPEDRWLRLDRPALRIVEADVAERVDARRLDRKTRYLASVAKGGRVPERAHGKFLLSGGLLVCPQCGGHFEARKHPWKGSPGDIYICSTRRRKPGMCTNTLALPIAETDDDVLGIVEGEVLGTRFIEELLSLVDTSPDPTAQLEAERQRLIGEVDNLVKSVAKGMPAETIAPVVKTYQAEVARLGVELRRPRPERPNLDKLRAALEQRAAQWKADQRAEPKVARLLLRRLVGPLTLWEESEGGVRWDAPIQANSLLDGLVHLGTSHDPPCWNQILVTLKALDSLRKGRQNAA